MSLEENKAIIRSWYEALNKRNLALAYELIAPNYFNHTLQLQGLKDFKQFMTMLIKGFPDFHTTAEDMIAEGDKVWTLFTDTGTHTGEYLGIVPTGKKITIRGVDISRIVDGKVTEEWQVTDSLDLLKQLGVIEYTEKGKKLFPEDVK